MESKLGSPSNGRLLLCVSLPLAMVWSRPFAYGFSTDIFPLLSGLLMAGMMGTLGLGRVPRVALAWLALLLLALLLRASEVPLYNLMLLPVALAVCTGLALGDAASRDTRILSAFGLGLGVGLVVNFIVTLLQFFSTEGLPSSWWVLPGGWSTGSSRPYGNLGQANHLALFFALSLVPLWWLAVRRRLPMPAALLWVLAASLMVALSGSRIGALCMAVLAAVALLWRRDLPPRMLPVFLAAPVLVLLFSWGAGQFALGRGQGGVGLLLRDSNTLSLRWLHWQTALDMIAAHPWAGVGWRDFLHATFEMRPQNLKVEQADHAHNLFLHLGAELGLPLMLFILVPLLVLALRAQPWRERDPAAQAGWLVLLLMFLYSQVEYPLWEMNFLFLAAFGGGLVLARTTREEAASRPRFPAFAGWVLTLASLGAMVDHDRAVAPLSDGSLLHWGTTLEEKLAEARRSVLFGSHAEIVMMSLVTVTPQNHALVLERTERLMHLDLAPPMLSARLAALCFAGQGPEARRLDTAFRQAFPERYEVFRPRIAPQLAAACGLPEYAPAAPPSPFAEGGASPQ